MNKYKGIMLLAVLLPVALSFLKKSPSASEELILGSSSSTSEAANLFVASTQTDFVPLVSIVFLILLVGLVAVVRNR